MNRARISTYALALSTVLVIALPDAKACEPIFDSYYTEVTLDPEHPNQCDWIEGACHIDLKGVKFQAAGANPPVIIWNHGSDVTVSVRSSSQACKIADYFVPLGYTVYVPIRRGHSVIDDDEDGANPLHSSTGAYIIDNYTGDDRIDELIRQVVDVRKAVKHVKEFNGTQTTKLALMGSSFGGMITVFANSKDLGQSASVAFSAGADSWVFEGGTQNTYMQSKLKAYAASALANIFFIQATWDYSTRPTSELSYFLANNGPTSSNGHEFQASIFDWGYEDDPEKTHIDFPKKTSIWGETVVAFLRREGVKP